MPLVRTAALPSRAGLCPACRWAQGLADALDRLAIYLIESRREEAVYEVTSPHQKFHTGQARPELQSHLAFGRGPPGRPILHFECAFSALSLRLPKRLSSLCVNVPLSDKQAALRAAHQSRLSDIRR